MEAERGRRVRRPRRGDVERDPVGRDARRDEWLPTEADEAFVGSLMHSVIERGKFANWIAPPARGINGQPIDFEYVRA